MDECYTIGDVKELIRSIENLKRETGLQIREFETLSHPITDEEYNKRFRVSGSITQRIEIAEENINKITNYLNDLVQI